MLVVLRKLIKLFGNIFFPPGCVECKAPLVWFHTKPYQQWLCDSCNEKANHQILIAPQCEICAATLQQERKFSHKIRWGRVESTSPIPHCTNCRNRNFSFYYCIVDRRAADIVQRLIVRFKYKGHYYLRHLLVNWMLESLEQEARFQKLLTSLKKENSEKENSKINSTQSNILIVSVPMHPWRRWHRTYNHAAVLATLLGKHLKTGVDNKALVRLKNTRSQTQFNRKDRLKNLKSIFAVRSKKYQSRVQGKQIILVDDVFTTGSTVDACAFALKQAGALSVYVLVTARR